MRLTVQWGPTPRNLNPETGSAVADTTPTLSWDAVEGAASYEVQLADNEMSLTEESVARATESEYTPTDSLSIRSEYYWRVRAVDHAGIAADWSNTKRFFTPNAIPYAIGAAGPAGGIVFYDKTSYSDGWRYMEAAPIDIDVSGDYLHVWGGRGTRVGGTGTAIGAGAGNTAAIVSAYGASEPYTNTGKYAARLSEQFEFGGYDDWFLPSRDELNEMYQKKSEIGYFGSYYYWSSSEGSSLVAWHQYFSNGYQIYSTKTFTIRVRAIRAF